MALRIELHYLPNIEYMGLLLKAGQPVLLEAHENYVKQTYRNRCLILTANKLESLTVPVHNTGKPTSKDIRIDYSLAWPNTHWRTVASAYGKSPFFEFYADSLQPIFYAQHATLWELNKAMLQWALRCLNAKVDLQETDDFEPISSGSDDLRNHVHPRHESRYYTPISYGQVFNPTRQAFCPNLSVLDLIFCVGGKQAKQIAEQSVRFPLA